MVFNSLIFIVFAVVFFAIWPFVAKRNHTRWGFIIAASLFFYGWWDWRYVPLMVLTALTDYYAGLGMMKYPTRRKLIFSASLIINLGVLAGFKYLGLFARSVNAVMALAGSGHAVPVVDLVLPLGISFYTFHSMSYTIDIYRGELKPTSDPLHFFAFVTLFPQLVAGPIVRASQLLPQLKTWAKPDTEMVWDGLKLIAIGYFKKMVIADNVAVAVNQAYSGPVPEAGGLYWWVVVTLFSMQVYCDFSGYTDIARGLGKWLGYELPLNFDHPYIFIKGPRDFWNRWHISMSTWFRDYLYFPLGGSKTGHAVRNLWITFGLMGLWHGAGWNFIMFGLLHGLWVVLERTTNWPDKLSRIPGGAFLCWALTIAQVWLAAAVFRSQTMEQAFWISKTMLWPFPSDVAAVMSLGAFPLGVAAAAIAIELFACFVSPRLSKLKTYDSMEPALVAVFLAAAIFLRGPGNRFIYFQF